MGSSKHTNHPIHDGTGGFRRQGFSLVEPLLVVAIAGLGFLAVVLLHTASISDTQLARQRTEAVILAQNRLDTFKSYRTLSGSPGLDYDEIQSGSDNPSAIVSNTSYTRTWNVVTSSDPAEKAVTVMVSWLDEDGGGHSVTLTSKIGRIDPANSGKMMLTSSGGLSPN